MIANAYLNEWRQIVPWSDNKMVEQDLIISRLLVELFNHPPDIRFTCFSRRHSNLQVIRS